MSQYEPECRASHSNNGCGIFIILIICLFLNCRSMRIEHQIDSYHQEQLEEMEFIRANLIEAQQ